MSDSDKRAILKDLLGNSFEERMFPTFSLVMDYLGNVNDIVSFAEIVPSLNVYIFGPVASRIFSYSSFIGVLLFPVDGILKIIDANKTGLRMYGYRATAYTVTAWAFNQAIPQGSPRILANLKSGPVVMTQRDVQEYHKVWKEASHRAVSSLVSACSEKNIPKEHLKIIFRAMCDGRPDNLSREILQSFEKRFSPAIIHIWRSNYNVVYPM